MHSGRVLPHGLGTVELVVVLLLVLDVLTMVDVVEQPFVHASQQCAQRLGVPPCAAHRAALASMRQPVLPLRSVQQATAPGCPHVERAAHRRTSLRHPDGRRPSRLRTRTTSRAHRTYAPWLAAPAQSHMPSTAARAARTACVSVQLAIAPDGINPSATIASSADARGIVRRLLPEPHAINPSPPRIPH